MDYVSSKPKGLDGVATMQGAMSHLLSFMNSSRATLERLAHQREREAATLASAPEASSEAAEAFRTSQES